MILKTSSHISVIRAKAISNIKETKEYSTNYLEVAKEKCLVNNSTEIYLNSPQKCNHPKMEGGHESWNSLLFNAY